MEKVPIVDIGSYIDRTAHPKQFSQQLRDICKNIGFFYVSNHHVPADLQESLLESVQKFFALPTEEKHKIHMRLGGRAWRGYFQLGEEYTSGKIDLKEGLYLGMELPETDPRVQAKVPLHGANLFPEEPAELKNLILTWQKQMEQLGYHILSAIAESLGLEADHFRKTICKEHLGLLRIFHYPPEKEHDPSLWAVGEHTDYGLITMLLPTDKGLQVKTKQGVWIDVDPIPGTFVVNIGDILERITGGLYKSTPHRARNTQGRSRYSVPYFFDPDWNAELKVLDIAASQQEEKLQQGTRAYKRWDQADLSYLEGFYGDYLIGKVKKVFPWLASQTL